MSKGNSTRYNNFNQFIQNNNLSDVGYVGNLRLGIIKERNKRPRLQG